MKLIITIDTEEDNWGDFSSHGYKQQNMNRIPKLQELFDTFSVKPTYLITYPIATDHKCIDMLGDIERSGRCEIGGHCHPWNTPPFNETLNNKNSMLCNLPPDLQYMKIRHLHETIVASLGITPISFRCGRWGYNQGVAESLLKLGYLVDTSITPYIDWRAYHGPDFSKISPHPFRISCKNILKETANGHLIEIPATIEFLQKHANIRNAVMVALSKRPINRLRLVGILHAVNLLNKVWLSPEMSTSGQMIKLTERLMKKNYEVINMFFHSTTLKAGLTQFVKTKDDERQFIRRIKEFLDFSKAAGIESVTLSGMAKILSTSTLAPELNSSRRYRDLSL